MKTMVSKITQIAIAFLMIGLMCLLIANNVAFTHSHQLSDGTIINHAHPYDKSNDTQPYKSHHHTQTELVFFINVQILFLIALFTAWLTCINRVSTFMDNPVPTYWQEPANIFKGRAPPFHQ
ncbi:MAG: hypothetical protein JW973_13600 [Bacteroidales bacterium]|nr:hypothetical protein [Bacteroidales bacterium]